MVGWGSTTSDLVLRLAGDARARRFVESRTVRNEVVRRYVAGESLSDALDITGELLARGRRVCIAYLAADPLDRMEADQRRKRLRRLARRLGQAGYAADGRVDLSVRLGGLGAHLGRDGLRRAAEAASVVIRTATAVGLGVTVETEPTLDQGEVIAVAAGLRDLGADLAIALPAAMRRTEIDSAELAADGWRVRLDKGVVAAAGLPGAYADRRNVDRAYVRCLQALIAQRPVPTVATHDPRLIAIAEELAARHGHDRDAIAYQLPYGVRPGWQTVVADRGGLMRVYLPYGPDWYPYLMSRLAEQPSDVRALLRARPDRARR